MKKCLIIIAVLAMCTAQASAGVTDSDYPGLQLWLKADAGVDDMGGMGMVAGWADQATGAAQGGSNDATAIAPIVGGWVTSAALNGQKAIRFSGAEGMDIAADLGFDLWDAGGINQATGDPLTGAGVFHAFMVVDLADSAPLADLLTDGPNFWGVQTLDGAGDPPFGADDNQMLFQQGAPNTWTSVWADPGKTIPSVIELTRAANGDMTISQNGVVVGSGNVGTFNIIAEGLMNIGYQATWGPTRYLNGDIAEVMVYHEDLSAGDEAAVKSYLGDKYGITIIPEPATIAMLGLGALALIRRKR